MSSQVSVKLAPAAQAHVAEKALRDLPGPRGLPFLGNLWQVDVKRLHLILEEWSAQFGPLYTFRLGRKPVLAVAEPALKPYVF